jgi:hypothetical protein
MNHLNKQEWDTSSEDEDKEDIQFVKKRHQHYKNEFQKATKKNKIEKEDDDEEIESYTEEELKLIKLNV